MTTIWQKLVAFLSKNWKTSLGGFLIAIVTILLGAEIITQEVAGTITTILISLGFIVSKDGDKTGV